MRRLFSFFLFIAVFSGAAAQEKLIQEGSFASRRAGIRAIPDNPERIKSVQSARELGIPDRRIYSNGRLVAIRRINANGKPEYLGTFNIDAAGTISTNKVWKDGGEELDLSGEGMVVGVWDGGVLLNSHREFGSRGRIMNPGADVAGHSTHVSGTIAARGIDGEARGMANGAIIEGYDWYNDLDEMAAAAEDGLLISNHSYGYIVGFDYNFDEERWEWWGDTEVSEQEDYLFGYYHSEARSYDLIAHDNPFYLIAKAAGNDRGDRPSPGWDHHVWQDGGWVRSNTERQADGGDNGFGSIGPVATAKNILAVGAVGDLPDGFTTSGSVIIENYSVFGPTDDGRIKPDLVSNGRGLYSTYSGSDSEYRYSSGTSMATPGVSGSLALIQEHYHNIHDRYLRSASLKGLVLHTANDAGNPGPDYSYGWGVMNTADAANLITDTIRHQLAEYLLTDQDELRMSLYCDGSQGIKATICWTDPAGNVPVPSLNPADRILVNDLDVRLVRSVDGREFRPFILDPLQPALPAQAGDNVLDNVEQVLLETPEKGFYEIVISHKGALKNGAQAVSLIVSGLTDHYFASGTYHLTDNNGAFILSSAEEYQAGMDVSWLITPENEEPVSLSFDFFDTKKDQDFLRIYDGADTAAPLLAEFSGLLPDKDTLVRASGASMWLVFNSEEQGQGKGFRANYCTTAPAEGFSVIEGEAWPCTDLEESYLVTGEDAALYRWQLPEDWELLESGRNYAKIGIGSGGGMLEVIPYNRCGESAAVSMAVESLAATPFLDSYAGDSVLCSGEQETLTVEKLDGAIYEWILPENWKGSSESNEINFIPSLDQGDVFASAQNSCGQGDSLRIQVLVKTLPREKEIYAVSDIICQYSPSIFYLNETEGVDYKWSVEFDWEISGESYKDSVWVDVGANSGLLYLMASNECGSTYSDRFFYVLDLPDNPMLRELGSIYDDLSSVEVLNATEYTLIQWYRNGVLIDSPLATGPSYVSYVPGVYSVGVQNREECSLIQDLEEGIDISAPDNSYSVHAGASGSLIVYNTTGDAATMNIYDLEGKLQVIHGLDPGISELNTNLQGVKLITIYGAAKRQVFRIFIR